MMTQRSLPTKTVFCPAIVQTKRLAPQLLALGWELFRLATRVQVTTMTDFEMATVAVQRSLLWGPTLGR